jgi:hypothetical protein
MAHNSFSEFEKIVKSRIDGKSGKANPKSYSIDGIRKITRELRRIKRNQGIETKRIGRQIVAIAIPDWDEVEFTENYGMSQSNWDHYQDGDVD